jgi:hypothetical protein
MLQGESAYDKQMKEIEACIDSITQGKATANDLAVLLEPAKHDPAFAEALNTEFPVNKAGEKGSIVSALLHYMKGAPSKEVEKAFNRVLNHPAIELNKEFGAGRSMAEQVKHVMKNDAFRLSSE